jgi:hypothetical protein
MFNREEYANIEGKTPSDVTSEKSGVKPAVDEFLVGLALRDYDIMVWHARCSNLVSFRS